VEKRRLMRVLMAIVGAIGAVVALFALLVKLNAGNGFTGCTGTAPWGWILPLVAGFLIGGVAWVLLFTRSPRDGGGGAATRSVPCPTCSKAVLADWRMCPYCGRRLLLDEAASG
jgi:hypothetical protein